MTTTSAPRIARKWLASVCHPSSGSYIIDPARIDRVHEHAAGLRNHTDTQLTAEAGRIAAIFRAQPAVCSAEQMIERSPWPTKASAALSA